MNQAKSDRPQARRAKRQESGTVPKANPGASASPTLPAARPEICSRRIGRFQRALIVDDDDGLRRALARLVRSWGATVIEATTVADGKRKLLSERPDLLIADVRLPDGSGREVVAAASKLAAPPLLAAMSGLASASEAFALAHCGVRIYLTKPFAQQELIEAIEVFLASDERREPSGVSGLSMAESLARFETRYHVTEREMALVGLVMAGVPRSRCPTLLNVSENTCKTMTRRLLSRCGARNVADIPRLVLLGEPGC